MELPDELVGIEDELGIDDESELDATVQGGDDETPSVERERFVFVDVGDRELALHVNAVRRLVDLDQVARVPRTSDAIDGVTDLRGSITAVIDPRELFDVDQPPAGPQELVVFATGDDDGSAGITVDEVHGVRAVPVTHVVLEPEDVEGDDQVAELLSDPLVAGLVRERDGDETVYHQVVDADAVLETAGEAAT